MFSTQKFGLALARLRKKRDMTQSELAEVLNLTRQAISKYEVGDSFPDVTVLLKISEVFGLTLDELIGSGEPTPGERRILAAAAAQKKLFYIPAAEEVLNLAPLLRPSELEPLAAKLSARGLNISHILELSRYLSDDGVLAALESSELSAEDEALVEKLIPLVDEESRANILIKIIEGELDWRLLKTLHSFAGWGIDALVEAAVIEGAIPFAALKLMRAMEEN